MRVTRCAELLAGKSHRYPPAEAAEAHRPLEGRPTVRPVVLLP
jgi:hypothetical protein